MESNEPIKRDLSNFESFKSRVPEVVRHGDWRHGSPVKKRGATLVQVTHSASTQKKLGEDAGVTCGSYTVWSSNDV